MKDDRRQLNLDSKDPKQETDEGVHHAPTAPLDEEVGARTQKDQPFRESRSHESVSSSKATKPKRSAAYSFHQAGPKQPFEHSEHTEPVETIEAAKASAKSTRTRRQPSKLQFEDDPDLGQPLGSTSTIQKRNKTKYTRRFVTDGDLIPHQETAQPEERAAPHRETTRDAFTHDQSHSTQHQNPHSTKETSTPRSSSDKLTFSQPDHKMDKLNRKGEKIEEKLADAREKLPTRRKWKKERVFDEVKQKGRTTFKFEKEFVPIEEAKWNQVKKRGPIKKGLSELHRQGHDQVSKVEHENVGVETAHAIEKKAEDAVRLTFQGAKGVYRFVRNRSYRQVAKLEQKVIQNQINKDAQQAIKKASTVNLSETSPTSPLHKTPIGRDEAPLKPSQLKFKKGDPLTGSRPQVKRSRLTFETSSQLHRDPSTRTARFTHRQTVKSPKVKRPNLATRLFQKRKIKRQYASALQRAKQGGQLVRKKSFKRRLMGFVKGLIKKNPFVWLKLGFLAIIMLLLMSILTMCMNLFSGVTTVVGGMSYLAEEEAINEASVLYTELETDLQLLIAGIETNFPGWDEYRFILDPIGHDPHQLMAFLTARFHDFTFAEVEPWIRYLFSLHYTLTFETVTEIRYEWEQVGWEWAQTGWNWERVDWELAYEWVQVPGYTTPIIRDPETGAIIWQSPPIYGWQLVYEWIPVMGWVEVMGWIPVYDWVPHPWHVLYTILVAQPFEEVLRGLMNVEETEHFDTLMDSLGLRWFVGSPFDVDWLPDVTSHFGYRINPTASGVVRQFHNGIDIGLPTGTPILAGVDGTVVTAAYDAGGYGNLVVIEKGEGVQVLYAHAHTLHVSAGQTVTRGQVIATVGSTGNATGAHLHLEVIRNGVFYNPIFFVETPRIRGVQQ